MSKTILLVDDDTLVRIGLEAGLAGGPEDFKIEVAANGAEGLKKALEVHPDLIVADMRMPEMTGLEMIAELRKDAWGKDVPVIVMSSDDTTDSLNQAMKSGITVYLIKSNITPDSLRQQIAEALNIS